MLTKNLPARAALAAILLVAGCGGSSDSDAPTVTKTPSSAAPTTPTATTPTAVVPTPGARPADDRSDAGAIAFSEFVINRIVRVTGGEDVDELLTLASADCKGCINLAKARQKNGTLVQQFDGPQEIRDAKVIKTSGDGTEYVVEQLLVSPAGRKVDTATGEVSETFGASSATFQVLMTWKNDQWVLGNYSAKSKA